MITKFSVLFLCVLVITGGAIGYGRFRRPVTFGFRTIIACMTVAVFALIYLYWKSRPT